MNNEIDKLLFNILSNQADENEIIFFSQWMKDPENEEYFIHLKDAWHLHDISSVTIPVNEQGREQFIHHIRKEKSSNRQKRATVVSFMIAAALIALSFLVYDLVRPMQTKHSIVPEMAENNHNTMIIQEIAIVSTSNNKVIDIAYLSENDKSEVVFKNNSTDKIISNTLIVPKGKRTMIFLPDSTKMWVNSESRVTFPSKFSQTDRVIEVNGNAFFEVKKEARPFRVITGSITTIALGTAFEVNNYDQQNSSVTLLEGSVSVNINSETEVLQLNQQITSNGLNLKKTNITASNYGQWRNNILVIDNESIDSMIKKLSRWHNITIENRTKHLETTRFTGKLNQGDIDEHLKIISANSNIKFTKEGEKIIMWN